MGSRQRLPSDHVQAVRRFAVLVASVALLLPAQAVWLTPPAAAVNCPLPSAGVGGGICEATFDASATWTIPDGVSSVDVVAVGGGGGGGSSQDPSSSKPGAGGGGGGGAVVQATYRAVTPGASATITVGAGGAGGVSGVSGTAGGTSSFVAGGVSVSAPGGSPGAGGFWGAPYAGGTGYGGASGADYAGGEPKLYSGGSPTEWETLFGGGGGGSSAAGGNAAEISGGDGGPGAVPSLGLFAGYSTAYAGGGGGGSEGTGGNGSYATSPGLGAAGGGAGNASTTSPGGAATANSGSGGGGTASFTNGTGGAGGSGLVIVRFLTPGGNWSQTISFTSVAPSTAVYHGTYTPTGTATSGLPVTFTIDGTTSSICSISGSVVSFTGVGTCTIDANQAGNTTYRAAPQVQQTFSVGKSSQIVGWTSAPPTNAVVGGTWNATGFTSSGLPVVFVVRSTSSSVCSIDASNVVHFTAAGLCAVDATQPGNADYLAATPVLQSFMVNAAGPADQTITFTSSAPTGATVGGPTYTPTASATSGLPVTLTIDASASSVCSIDASGVVSFAAAGTCTVDANQAGDADYNPATQVQQTFSVAVVPAGPILYVTQTGAGSADCSSWANACSALSRALTQATPGDQIWVAAGTYTPDTTDLPAPRTATFQLKAGVAVYGGFAGTETSLDQRDPKTNVTTLSGDLNGDDGADFANNSENTYHVVTGTGTGPLAVLAGFTVTGGNANGGGTNSYGAGMYIASGGSPTVRNVIFSGNTASNGAGGGMANNPGSPTLSSVTFSNNTATNGGGMANLSNSSPSLTDVTFSGNTATGGGGAMYSDTASLTLTDVTFSGNTANASGASSSGGGAMYNQNTASTLSNVTFSENSAGWGGGAVWINQGDAPKYSTWTDVTFIGNHGIGNGSGGGAVYSNGLAVLTLTNATFSGNWTHGTSSGNSGGAIYNMQATVTLTNATFSGNSATSGGGAIENLWGTVTLTNATFSGNSGGSAGAIEANGGGSNRGSVTVRNSILYGDHGYVGYPEYRVTLPIPTTMTYSDVQGGYSGTGNISANPLLGPLGYYGGSTKTFPLLPGSTAIDAADSTACPATDQRGVTRPQGSGCDMGAFEAQPFSLSVSGGDSQSAAIGHAFADPLQVTVSGTGTDPVAGGNVTFSAPATGATATFSSNPATIGTDGTASAAATASGAGGSYTVSASAAGATAPASFSLTNIAQMTPAFTFDLSALGKTYGDASFSVAGYASRPADDAGVITFALGSGSVGCTVTSVGQVTIAGAATGSDMCVITASIAADGSYLAAGPISASFNIAKAELTVTADNKSMTYGGTLPTPSVSYSGFVYGQTIGTSGVTGSPSCSIVAGPYTVSGSPYSIGCTQDTLSAANYSFAFVNGELTVTAGTPTFTFVLPDAFSKTYGDAPFSVAAYASKPADDTGAITFALGSGSVGCTVTSDGTVTITSASESATAAFACVIEASLASDANYLAAGPLSQSFPIWKAPTALSAISGHATYGGNATLTATLTNRANGDPLAGKTVTFQIGTSGVGSATTDSNGVATLADVTLPAGYTNAATYSAAVKAHFATEPMYYFGSAAAGDLTVDKATLTITPSSDQSMVYGSTPPANLGYALSGFVNDETDAGLRTAGALTGQASCSAGVSQTSSVASYTISCTQGTLTASNYAFTVSTETVTFSVTPATLTITPSSDQSMVYGSTPPANLGYALSGFVNDETDAALRTAGALTGQASCSAGVSQTSPVASYSIACTAGDLEATNYSFAASTDEVTFSVTPATLIVTADDKTVQYSDPVTLTATITGFVNSETLETSGVSGSASLTTSATLNLGNVTSAPGTYSITPSLGTLAASNYVFTLVGGSLTVTQEDARASYTGDALFWGTSATATSATVTLTATIKDITALADDPAYDSYAGDISHATVTFVNRDASNAPLDGCSDLPVALVSSGDTTVGTVACKTTMTISNSGATPYTIGIVVSGYYTDDTSDENAVIDVAAPITSYFITGGGYLTESSSAGTYAADAGRKANFGFNVKFNKGAKSLQGNVNILFRQGGHTYQIKSNALTSLGEKPSPCTKATASSSCTATFVSKANLQDITDPSHPVSLGGNLTFQMSMTDYGSRAMDTIGFTLYNGSALLFSSDWNGTRTVEQLLGGGNLSVR